VRRRSVLVLGALVLLGCRTDPSSAQATAERFLDAHYVRIDRPTAEAIATGVASKKLADERRLVEGHMIDEATRLPNVYYRLEEERPDGDARSRLIYRVTFAVEGADTFDRRVLILLRREAEAWRVANFEEFE